MGLFGSSFKLGSEALSSSPQERRDTSTLEAQKALGVTPGSRGGIQGTNGEPGPLTNVLRGAGIVGAGLGIYSLLKKPGASLGFAKGIANIFNSSTAFSPGKKGMYGGSLIGTARDLLEIKEGLNILGKNSSEAIEELYKSRTMQSTRGGTQATIDDLLRELKGSDSTNFSLLETTIGDIEKTLPKGSSLRDLPLGYNIMREGGSIQDYRGLTPEGLINRALEFAHVNLKIPILNFAPTDVLLGQAWAHDRNAVRIGAKSLIRGEKLGAEGLLVGNKLFREGVDKPIEGNFKRIRADTSLGTSSYAIKGELKFKKHKDLLEEGDMGYVNELLTEFYERGRKESIPPEFLEKYGHLFDYKAKLERKNSLFAELKSSVRTRKESDIKDELDTLRDISWSTYKKESAEALEYLDNATAGFENPFISNKYSQQSSSARETRNWFKRAGGGTPVYTGEGTPPPLSIFDKARLAMKMDVPGYSYVDDAGNVIGKGIVGPKKSGGFQNFVEGLHDPKDAIDLGDGIKKVPIEFSIVEGGNTTVEKLFTSEAAQSFWHFFWDRPNRLFESMTGLGVRPSSSVLKQAAISTVGMYAMFEGIKGTIEYANFIGLGVPAKATAAAAGTAQVAAQAFFTATGLGPLASFMEDNLPGSVHSLGSQILRTIGLTFAGAMIGRKMGGGALSKFSFMKQVGSRLSVDMTTGSGMGYAGALAGGALGLSTVFIDPTKGVAQQYREATGESRVAVRNARWWMAGRQPYEGDYIKYFDASWTQKLWNYDAKDRLDYGSTAAKFSNTWLPTPSNAFGLKPLLDPYYKEKRNFANRPYPVVSPVGENIPVVGGVFSSTIGQIIKPELEFNVENPDGSSHMGPEYGMYGTNPSEGAALGFVTPGGSPSIRDPGGMGNMAQNTIGDIQAFSGVYGFTSRLGLKALFGEEQIVGTNFQMEGSSNMTDKGRRFADWNLGGLWGLSEYPRRLYLPRDNDMNYVNEIPNTMPRWLPGQYSKFGGDRDHPTDFTVGDAYAGAGENMEYRLPGAGYKAMYGYHGGDQPDYVDTYSILSDVAPGSEAHAYYKRQVEEQIQKGNVDEKGQKVYNQRNTEEEMRRTGKYQFKDYADSVIDGPKNSMGQMVKDYLGFANVNIEQAPDNPMMAPFRQMWDNATHTRIPGLAWAQGKFMHNRTPFEEYRATQVHGTEFADWASPYKAFVRPAFDEVVGAAAGQHYIPGHVQQKWEVEEYYDKLKYLKARRLEERSRAIGDDNLAAQYAEQQKQTIVGMNYANPTDFNRNIFKALPDEMRPFAVAFAKATPEEAQRIMPYLPEYQRDMWENVWKGNAAEQEEVDTTDSRMRADEQVAEFFSNKALPDADSNAWNPDVSLDEYKIKTAEHEGLNYNTMGIPEAKAREYNALGRADVLIDTSYFNEDQERKRMLQEELRVAGSTSRVSMSSLRTTNYMMYNSRQDLQDRLETYNGRF